jgi:hypothetical protein
MTCASSSLVPRLLGQGDFLEINNGRLVLKPASGKTVPPDWLQEKREFLIQETLQITGVTAYAYTGYTTGNYIVKRNMPRGGVTLNYVCLTTGEEAYAIFNADLTRQTTTKHGKKGTPLLSGQFRIGKNHAIYKFWQNTGLPFPKRLAALHDYMGNLKPIIFTCSLNTDDPRKQRRIDTKHGIFPLNITAEQIRLAMRPDTPLPDNCRKTNGQLTDNYRTKLPDNDFVIDHTSIGLQLHSSTCDLKHDISKQGSTITRESNTSIHPSKSPHEQSTEEWLSDLELHH